MTRVIRNLFLVTILLAGTANAQSANKVIEVPKGPTPQQLEELKQSRCDYFKNGTFVRTEEPIAIAGPDGMIGYNTGLVRLSQERFGPVVFKTNKPYYVACGRFTLKHGEKCYEGVGCFQEEPREAKDCGGETVVVRAPEGSSIKFPKPGCWHLARKR